MEFEVLRVGQGFWGRERVIGQTAGGARGAGLRGVGPGRDSGPDRGPRDNPLVGRTQGRSLGSGRPRTHYFSVMSGLFPPTSTRPNPAPR